MEKTYIVQKCLFDDLFDDVIAYLLQEKSGKEIPEWGSYDIEKIENIYPLRRYHASLHEGPVENLGEVVAYATIDIVTGEDKAEVVVKWGQ